MNEYVAVVKRTSDDEELQHYGVKGMKWGVRRATKALSKATTDKQRDKAVDKLNKHREKSASKIKKLEAKGVKLEKSANDRITKREKAAASLEIRSANLERKAYGRFTSKDRASELLYKSRKLNAQAKELRAKADWVKKEIEDNKEMIKTFQTAIKDIDATLVNRGKRYVNG